MSKKKEVKVIYGTGKVKSFKKGSEHKTSSHIAELLVKQGKASFDKPKK